MARAAALGLGYRASPGETQGPRATPKRPPDRPDSDGDDDDGGDGEAPSDKE
jgi:hypothetical protein